MKVMNQLKTEEDEEAVEEEEVDGELCQQEIIGFNKSKKINEITTCRMIHSLYNRKDIVEYINIDGCKYIQE